MHAVLQLRSRHHDFHVLLALDELLPSIRLSVLQGEAHPVFRLLELGRRRLLGTIFRFLDLRGLDALLRFHSRLLDDLEQLSSIELLQCSKDGAKLNHFDGRDGFNGFDGFGGGHVLFGLEGLEAG